MDEELLDGLDTILSEFISSSTISDPEELDSLMQKLIVSSRNKTTVSQFLLEEKDFIDTLASFLRAVPDNVQDVHRYVRQVLQCFVNIFQNCSHLKNDLEQISENCGLFKIFSDLLSKNEKSWVRLACELQLRVQHLKGDHSNDADILSIFKSFVKGLLSATSEELIQDPKCVVELRNCWNCFLLLDSKQLYGDMIQSSSYLESLVQVIEGKVHSAASTEDWLYICENALVSDEFRATVLKNSSFIKALTASFHSAYTSCEMGILRHLIVVLRNVFYGMDVENSKTWMSYEHAHLLVRQSEVPADLQEIISQSDNKVVQFFGLELASFNLLDLDNSRMFESVEQCSLDTVGYLKTAVKAPDHTINIPGSEYNTSVYNLVSLLSRMMYCDEIKRMCASKELIELLLSFLESPMAPKILVEVLSIFDQLCFLVDEFDCSNPKLVNLAKFLAAESSNLESEKFAWVEDLKSDKRVVSAAKSLCQGLAVAEEVIKPSENKPLMVSGSTQTDTHYVMLSYNWESKHLVKTLVQTIRDSGFEVWLDDEKMLEYGDINDGMADAVENCRMVVAVVSEKYKLSKNCRRELEYADNRNKPYVIVKKDASYEPNGWLGLMMGKKLYHCLDPGNLKQSCESVIEAIKSTVDGTAPNTQTSAASKNEAKDESSDSVGSSGAKSRVMDHDEYKDWVKKTPAVKFLRKDKNKKLFNEFVVAALADQVKTQSVQLFTGQMRDSFNLSESEALTLYKVLQTSSW